MESAGHPAAPAASAAQPAFRWAVGIEGSFIPHLGIDQYEWTQHDRFWREDFALIAGDLECRWMRYPLPWHEIEREPGVFDWSWTDARFALADELGLRLMVDLAHFGTPVWLPDAFAEPLFPEAIARFARAFGERYAGRPCIPTVCPVNEPLITALFCGDIGLWPPYGRGLDNYMTVLSRLAQGLVRGIQALRETMPGVEIVVCDSLEIAMTREPESSEKTSPFLRESLGADVARRVERRHIVTDLVLGRIDDRHPLHGWMRRHGFPAFDLKWFSRNRQTIDLIGLDYYPHTEVELFTTPEGYYRQRLPEPPIGLFHGAQDYWNRYGIPLMITETSVGGNDADKLAWLHRSVDDVRRLRAEGFPVVGYTWWPAIDHLDWDGAMLHQTGHIHAVGIYRLERQPDGTMQREPTELRDVYRGMIRSGDEAAGELVRSAVDAERPGASRRAGGPGGGRLDPLDFPIVAHSQIDWMGNWQRPQAVLSRLQRRHPVLYIERPRWMVSGDADDRPARSALRAFPHFPNLFVLTLHLPAVLRDQPDAAAAEERRLVAAALARAPLAGRFAQPVQWFYDPSEAPAYLGWEGIGARAVVYDCIEQWAAFPGAPAGIEEDERQLLAAADLVLTRTARLQLEKSPLVVRGSCRHLPDGVNASLFIKATGRRSVVPHDSDFIKHPVLGFFGTVDERLDLDLIARVAAAEPNWNLVFVGPVSGVNPAILPRGANLFWLGGRPFYTLQDYVKGFDVCLVPYRLDGAMPWHSPLKVPEYLIAGRPVVSTALPEVRATWEGDVRIAGNAEEFVVHCREAIKHRDPTQVRAAQRHAARRRWPRVMQEIEAALAEVAPAHMPGAR